MEFGPTDDLGNARFVDADLRGAHFVRADLSGVVMRAVDVSGVDLDGWLGDDASPFLVNGVAVMPLVDAALDSRFPGRSERHAGDPAGLRGAWSTLERTWQAAVERAEAMPAGTVELSVAGEWSFAQTLRHLVMATDVWLRRTVLGIEQPFSPLGQPFREYESDGYDMSVFTTDPPSWDAVLAARADRVAMVRGFLADVAQEDLTDSHPNPWAPEREITTIRCLHVIMNEEWEHYRYAMRDLDAIQG